MFTSFVIALGILDFTHNFLKIDSNFTALTLK